MHTPATHSSPDPSTTLPPLLDFASLQQRLKAASASVRMAAGSAWKMEALGDAASHPADSPERALAEFRGEIDAGLAALLAEVLLACRWRAGTSRSDALLSTVVGVLRGEACETLRLMERHEALFGAEHTVEGVAGPETLAEAFARDTYLRVSVLSEIAGEHPGRLRRVAGQMEAWPMLVAPSSDPMPEFQQLAETLNLGGGDRES